MNNSFFKAAILEKIKKDLKIKKLKLKNPQKNQILIKLKYSGVCRSQIMEIDGKRENKKLQYRSKVYERKKLYISGVGYCGNSSIPIHVYD